MKYWLKDSDEYPIFEVEIEKLDEYCCDFIIYKVCSWYTDCSHNIYEKKFIAEVHWKWDFCTHWRFYGEDYYESAEKDSYYHICSDHSDYIRMFAFIRKLMYSLLGDEQDWYSDKDKELDELVLKGFEIVEVKQMNYREIISWANNKLKQEERQNQFDIDMNIFPIRPINIQNDAVRELVLECCDNTARTPMCEINVLNNEDMIILKKKYDDLKLNNEALIKLLKVAYHNPNKFSEVVYRKMSEMGVKDVSLCDFVECAKNIRG